MVQPLASFGSSRTQSNTNLSRSISLTLLDEDGKEISFRTDATDPIKLLIPRDPNVIIPLMTRQNVTRTSNATPHHLLFNLHFVNITSSLPVSVHFEMDPRNDSVGYLLIYDFDRSPILNTSLNQLHGWKLLCPSGKTHHYRHSAILKSF